MSRRVAAMIGVIGLSAGLSGCGPSFGPEARYGITFYCPGAGNMDFGDQGIRAGLQRAGYKGQVGTLLWTISFNVALDQIVKEHARFGARRLTEYIEQYVDQYPSGQVNLVGLSAGTGVAIWALEGLRPKYKVSNVVLISSSLSHDYDIGAALEHVTGKVYCYYSPSDAVLTVLMKPFGTIDGKPFTDGAGAVGLHPPHAADRVVNIEWRPEFSKYGYNGGHGDATNADFVYAEIAPHLIGPTASARPETDPASTLVTAPPAEHPD